MSSAIHSVAIQRIAYAWALVFVPHIIKLGALKVAGYDWDNTIGRDNMKKDSTTMRISEEGLSRAKRADASHNNGNESFPLFAIATLSAVVSGVDGSYIDYYQKLYLGLRVAYISLFVLGGNNQGAAGLRTLTWLGSVYSSITLILQGSRALAARGL